MSLIAYLQQIPDYRTQPRYPLWVILMLVIMGTMSDCLGYRALADFVARHQKVLLELMELPHSRLPSYSTLRRAMVRLDWKALAQAFNTWSAETGCLQEGQQVAIDGKSIKASVQDYDQSYQDFISVVSAFSIQSGTAIALQPMRNREVSEIATVQSLLATLEFKNVCFTLDALHAQKKLLKKSSRVAMII